MTIGNIRAYLDENGTIWLNVENVIDAAKKFQAKIADEILSAIRKYGYYSVAHTPAIEKELGL